MSDFISNEISLIFINFKILKDFLQQIFIKGVKDNDKSKH